MKQEKILVPKEIEEDPDFFRRKRKILFLHKSEASGITYEIPGVALCIIHEQILNQLCDSLSDSVIKKLEERGILIKTPEEGVFPQVTE
jgi:hypothetical protein